MLASFLLSLREGLEAVLFGYNANPSLSESLTYLAYFLGVGVLWKPLTGKMTRSQTT